MDQHSIILFDGVCNLCNAAVQFVIRRDNTNHFLFASLQSEEGKKILTGNNLPVSEMNSFILLENGKVYDRSTAALKVVRKLKGLWRFLYGFIIVPKFMRDAIYQVVSKNRYQWFGKKDECMIPTPDLIARFLN
ncbi:MAG: thiol-disulfide oxidoreductase DCC family protein [Ginsengibacter sp.]